MSMPSTTEVPATTEVPTTTEVPATTTTEVPATATTEVPPSLLSVSYWENYAVVKVHVQEEDVARASPPSTHYAFLIDTSGSMEGVPLDSVKRTLHAGRDLFQETDTVTLVTFDDEAHTIVSDTRMDEAGKTTFYTAVDSIQTSGCTNLEAGLVRLHELGAGKYDTIILLTDGLINVGMTSEPGLQTIAMNLGGSPTTPIALHAMGYGPQHNRTLLRNLATKSRGSYSYITTDESLPIALGNVMTGMRTEEYQNVTLTLSEGWRCEELDNDGVSYRFGGLVRGRDYWAVFKKTNTETSPITLRFTGTLVSGTPVSRECTESREENTPEIQSQILRARMANLLSTVSARVERHNYERADVDAMKVEFDALSAEMNALPLVLRMKGQLAEVISLLDEVRDNVSEMTFPTGGRVLRGEGGVAMRRGGILGGIPIHFQYGDALARLASGATTLSVQRETSEDPGDISLFNSAPQRAMSSLTRTVYQNTPARAITTVPVPPPGGSPIAPVGRHIFT